MPAWLRHDTVYGPLDLGAGNEDNSRRPTPARRRRRVRRAPPPDHPRRATMRLGLAHCRRRRGVGDRVGPPADRRPSRCGMSRTTFICDAWTGPMRSDSRLPLIHVIGSPITCCSESCRRVRSPSAGMSLACEPCRDRVRVDPVADVVDIVCTTRLLASAPRSVFDASGPCDRTIFASFGRGSTERCEWRHHVVSRGRDSRTPPGVTAGVPRVAVAPGGAVVVIVVSHRRTHLPGHTSGRCWSQLPEERR
jgi:hypothetical protein